MTFELVPCPVPNMTTWCAVRGSLSFIVSQDHEYNIIAASVKVLGTTPFDGTRHDLGEFASVAAAKAACEAFRYD